MPSPKKVGWAQLRVGIMALAALAILAVLLFLLTGSGSVFSRNVQLRTYMQDSAGVAENSPVRLNGILVGNIDAVRLSGSKQAGRVVEVVIGIEDRFLKEIPVDSVAGIAASNLLGDKYINITKGTSAQTVQPNAELRSLQAQDIPELIAQTTELLAAFQTIVKRVDGLLADVESGKGNIGKFLKDEEFYTHLNAIASEAQRLLTDVRTGKGTVSRLLYDDSLYQEFRAPLKRIDALLADLQSGKGTAGKLMKDEALYAETRESIAEIRKILAGIEAGRGTAGKLVKDEALYKQMNTLLARVDATIDKVNSGQGTLGQLLVNPQLYDALNLTTREAQSLIKDMRANPKKFLTIKLEIF